MTSKEKTIRLIDDLKATCQSYGLGNDGNEYKIITQMFMYKYLCDRFGYQVKHTPSPYARRLREADKWETVYAELSEQDRWMLLNALSPDDFRFEPQHLLSTLWNQQTDKEFDKLLDDTMVDLAQKNEDIFCTITSQNTKIPLFERLTGYVTDSDNRAKFAGALIDKLNRFSFEETFGSGYDFFADIFEYLIKDYNTAGGGKYAEYYTPKAIAAIMARLLVGEHPDLHNIEVYDPSAGTGTLLIALAHQIGNDRCTIFAQDISQRSNKMLKLNLVLNGLVTSLDHAIQGDTLTEPYHKSDDRTAYRQFDYVVSNPPFKMDFSDTQPKIKAKPERFFVGVPNITPKSKDKMAIYTCFVQHVINSLKPTGRGAIVVPTGFITAKSGLEQKLLRRLVDERWVYGCVSMPPNVFANTGTNVSVLFLDKSGTQQTLTLIDASKLGEDYQEGNIKKKRLRPEEIEHIIDNFRTQKAEDQFSVVVNYDEVKQKGYSLSAGTYFDIKIEYEDITEEQFRTRMDNYEATLNEMFQESHKLEEQIREGLRSLKLNQKEG